MKITADTITDEQIRELMTQVSCHEGSDRWELAACYAALGMDETDDSSALAGIRVRNARARCAEILNARSVKS